MIVSYFNIEHHRKLFNKKLMSKVKKKEPKTEYKDPNQLELWQYKNF